MAAESKIEGKVCRWARANGWWVAKVTSPGLNGVLDRVFIKNRFTLWVEFKAPGKLPTEQQQKRHREMRAAGAIVLVWDDYEKAIDELNLF